MSQVLSLFNYKPSDVSHSDVPDFLLFESSRDLQMYRFSPQITQIGESLYVADLEPTRSYWNRQAEMQNTSVREVLRQVAVSENRDRKRFFVFCDHPFRGHLFYQSLQRKGAKGDCFFMDTLFSLKSYENLSWQDWIWSVKSLESWWEKSRQLVKERSGFSTQMARLERFLERMGLESIADLKEAQFHEMQRRFSRFLGMVWRWTFEKVSERKSSGAQQSFCFVKQSEEQLLGFPWESFHLFEPPVCENLLEFPLSTWDQIELELRRDLEKLSESQGVQPPFQVMRFLWSLVLYDGDECHSPVEFNYPLCMQQDREQEFAVTLKQLGFCFEQLKNRLKEKAKESDFMNMPFVLGWTLKTTHIVYNRKGHLSLFPEVQNAENHRQDLKELQNKLKSPIKSYRVHPSHVPSWDFSEKSLEEMSEDGETAESCFLPTKPLFLFHHPLPLESSEIRFKRFLERTSSDWWESQAAGDHFRDYYICQLTCGDIVWGYRDFKGDWFKHGLYS